MILFEQPALVVGRFTLSGRTDIVELEARRR